MGCQEKEGDERAFGVRMKVGAMTEPRHGTTTGVLH